MKNLSALICSFAILIFSATAHAAPVQYRITATHIQETINNAPIDANNYFFADGTIVTATFYYDSAAPAKTKDQKIPLPPNYPLLSIYEVKNDFIFEVDEHVLYSSQGNLITLDSEISPYSDSLYFDLYASSPNNNFGQLSFGDFSVHSAQIVMGGSHDMFLNRLLPNTLSELNPNDIIVGFNFTNSAGEYRYVRFANGNISQVPLPGAALFFLSGLIGLSANIFRKAKK